MKEIFKWYKNDAVWLDNYPHSLCSSRSVCVSRSFFRLILNSNTGQTFKLGWSQSLSESESCPQDGMHEN